MCTCVWVCVHVCVGVCRRHLVLIFFTHTGILSLTGFLACLFFPTVQSSPDSMSCLRTQVDCFLTALDPGDYHAFVFVLVYLEPLGPNSLILCMTFLLFSFPFLWHFWPEDESRWRKIANQRIYFPLRNCCFLPSHWLKGILLIYFQHFWKLQFILSFSLPQINYWLGSISLHPHMYISSHRYLLFFYYLINSSFHSLSRLHTFKPRPVVKKTKPRGICILVKETENKLKKNKRGNKDKNEWSMTRKGRPSQGDDIWAKA